MQHFAPKCCISAPFRVLICRFWAKCCISAQVLIFSIISEAKIWNCTYVVLTIFPSHRSSNITVCWLFVMDVPSLRYSFISLFFYRVMGSGFLNSASFYLSFSSTVDSYTVSFSTFGSDCSITYFSDGFASFCGGAWIAGFIKSVKFCCLGLFDPPDSDFCLWAYQLIWKCWWEYCITYLHCCVFYFVSKIKLFKY